MADENKKARELQRKFDAVMRELAEQDEAVAEIFGVEHPPLAPTLPRIRFVRDTQSRAVRPGAFVVRG